MGEFRTVLLAAQYRSDHIYNDLYASFKEATEQISHWEANGWQVNTVPVWQTDSLKQLLGIGKQRVLYVGWVKGHDRIQPLGSLTSRWTALHSCGRLMLLPMIKIGSACSNGYMLNRTTLIQCADLYQEGIARGWPVWVKLRERIVTACSQCWLRLNKDHLSKAPPLHIWDKKHYGTPGKLTVLVHCDYQMWKNLFW